jgi:hypothetical protein
MTIDCRFTNRRRRRSTSLFKYIAVVIFISHKTVRDRNKEYQLHSSTIESLYRQLLITGKIGGVQLLAAIYPKAYYLKTNWFLLK